jgi:Glucose / Sorbosone dehydrogenase
MSQEAWVRVLRWAIAVVLLLSPAGAASARAASLQSIGSFDQPIYVTSDPGNPNRLFVVERGGKIELVQGGSAGTFADLTSVVDCCDGERGLLSMALAPDFDTTGRFYVDYTGKSAPGEIHVAELRASGDSAAIGTRRNVLTIPHPGESNHNGGQLQFGPDGYLYVSTGDGGGSDDQHHNSQDLGSLLGKLLRIDPRRSGVHPYTVPAGNPFAGAGAPFDTIWSYGLRNPFRFSFDRSSGDLVIGDVGQDAEEEVDYAPAPGLGRGADYGWNCREGLLAGPATDPQCSTPPAGGFVDPVFSYSHSDPSSPCAIIGGYVARDAGLGSLYGRYLYADLCTGDVRSLALGDPFASDASTGLHVDNPNSFGEDSCGRLYVVSGDGEVDRLVGARPASCPAPRGSTRSARKRTVVRIGARRRRVRRGRRALVKVKVTPCAGRRGQRVRLLRGGRPAGSKRLSRACVAFFHPRIRHRSTFKATSPRSASYRAATSRRLTILALHRRG